MHVIIHSHGTMNARAKISKESFRMLLSPLKPRGPTGRQLDHYSLCGDHQCQYNISIQDYMDVCAAHLQPTEHCSSFPQAGDTLNKEQKEITAIGGNTEHIVCDRVNDSGCWYRPPVTPGSAHFLLHAGNRR